VIQDAIDLSDYDPMERSAQQNPFPYYAALRREAPVFRHRSGMFFVSTMDAVNQVLEHPLVFSSQFASQGTMGTGNANRKIAEILEQGYPPINTLLTADPPAQTRYRKSIGRPFGNKRTKQLEPALREIAAKLVAAWGRDVAFMDHFALPLPIRAIALALTMSPDREADIKRWSDDSVASLGVAITDERRVEAARGVVQQQKYWVSRFEQARESPRDEIVSNLVNVDFEDHTGALRKLENNELISIIQQLMVAGNETTTKLLNEAMMLLVENPPVWDRIKNDPAAIPPMVEEALRLSTPNQGMFRVCTEDAEVAGVKIPKGSRLWVIFGSANRDEKYFPEPDRFDPTRPNLKDHIAFGKGTHFCPGAPLSRLEATVSFEQITKAIDSVDFAEGYEVEYEPSYILRGLAKLDIRVTPA
jgi:cytochrome P450